MLHPRFGLVLVLLLALLPRLAASDPLRPGHWELVTIVQPQISSVQCIVLVEQKDGQWTATLAAPHPRIPGQRLDAFKVDGKTLTLTLDGPVGKLTFVAELAGTGPEIKGFYGDDRRLQMAILKPTEKSELAPEDLSRALTVPEPMRLATSLTARLNQLRNQHLRETDAEKKTQLAQEVNDLQKRVNEEVPRLYREVVSRHGDELAGSFAAMTLISQAARTPAPANEVRAWIDAVLRASQPYGDRWVQEQRVRIAEALRTQPDLVPIALELARAVDQGSSGQASLDRQSRLLNLLHGLETKAGDETAAAKTKARLDKIELALDQEYQTKVPPFKPTPFAGRKSPSTRAVVMELFTGAQCPPCVAADVAFDALVDTYRPADVVFLQYHLHIPGPDPLTNADAEARFQYYRQAFANDMRGTPSTVFNGKPAAGGGGGMANAENKYGQYRGIIEPLLEQSAVARLELTAQRSGNRVTMSAKVSDLASPKDTLRLRFVLVEDSVRYVGGNALRFHHHVVRDFPGGVAGFPVADGQSVEANVNLDDLRQKLNQYLADYAARRPFPKPDRPMDLQRLRVMALLQDDETHAILDARQVELPPATAQR
ncbi:MAG TPA: hypothetical protein PKD86_11105 [Gemmatales bacterium]|nr:hypothetical protein [Gemmatales bacterium]